MFPLRTVLGLGILLSIFVGATAGTAVLWLQETARADRCEKKLEQRQCSLAIFGACVAWRESP